MAKELPELLTDKNLMTLLLAPDLDVLNDERVQMSGGSSSSTAPFVDV